MSFSVGTVSYGGKDVPLYDLIGSFYDKENVKEKLLFDDRLWEAIENSRLEKISQIFVFIELDAQGDISDLQVSVEA